MPDTTCDVGHSSHFCDVCFDVLIYNTRKFLPQVRTDRPLTFRRPNYKYLAQLRRRQVIASSPRGRVPSPKSRHIECSKWARNLLLRCASLPSVSSQFIEEWRTTDEARDIDRLIAG